MPEKENTIKVKKSLELLRLLAGNDGDKLWDWFEESGIENYVNWERNVKNKEKPQDI